MPLHARVMALFDVFKEVFHHVVFDNLYNYAAYYWASFNHPLKPLVHGVTRKKTRYTILCTLTRGEELEGSRSCSRNCEVGIIRRWSWISMFYSITCIWYKPVQYVSMISNKVKWIVNERLVFNVETKKEIMKFLRLNEIDTYNYDIGSVDIADQLRVF